MSEVFVEHCRSLLSDILVCMRDPRLLDLPVYCAGDSGDLVALRTNQLLLASVSPLLADNPEIDCVLLPDLHVHHFKIFIHKLLSWNWICGEGEYLVVGELLHLLGITRSNVMYNSSHLTLLLSLPHANNCEEEHPSQQNRAVASTISAEKQPVSYYEEITQGQMHPRANFQANGDHHQPNAGLLMITSSNLIDHKTREFENVRLNWTNTTDDHAVHNLVSKVSVDENRLGGGRFQCDHCPKRFKARRLLRDHLNIHLNLKPHKCDECGKGFKQASHLIIHKKNHTGERPHVCHKCGKTFSIRSNLKKHANLHENNQRCSAPSRLTGERRTQAPGWQDLQQKVRTPSVERPDDLSTSAKEDVHGVHLIDENQDDVFNSDAISHNKESELDNNSKAHGEVGAPPPHDMIIANRVDGRTDNLVISDQNVNIGNGSGPLHNWHSQPAAVAVLSAPVSIYLDKGEVHQEQLPEKHRMSLQQRREGETRVEDQAHLQVNHERVQLDDQSVAQNQKPHVQVDHQIVHLKRPTIHFEHQSIQLQHHSVHVECKARLAPTQAQLEQQSNFEHPLAELHHQQVQTEEEDTEVAENQDGEPEDSPAVLTTDSIHCSMCTATFSSVLKLQEHCRMDHRREKRKPDGYNCPQCGKVFKSNSRLNAHLVSHTGEKAFPCNYCFKRFSQKAHANKHMRTVHLDRLKSKAESGGGLTDVERKFVESQLRLSDDKPSTVCPECDKEFSCKTALNKHLMLHRNEKPFHCPICPNKRFVQKSHLVTHMLSHSGTKSHLCSICDKGFYTKSQLRRHSKLHSSDRKALACEHCDRTYAGPKDLKVHMLRHTGETPFACDTCGNKFRSDRLLTNHRRIHTGERPFVCRNCDKSFASASGLNHHLKRKFACKEVSSSFKGLYSLKGKVSTGATDSESFVIMETVEFGICEEGSIEGSAATQPFL